MLQRAIKRVAFINGVTIIIAVAIVKVVAVFVVAMLSIRYSFFRAE